MKKSNFFIIGAPKCGTISLAHYLGDHPEIFLSDPKEPDFFRTDVSFRRLVENLDDYNALFKAAGSEHKAVGEASVNYLRSYKAVLNILEYNPAAKFIVMLRNPIDMIYSWHYHALFYQYHDIENFEVAWCSKNYKTVCSLGEQMERLYGIVSKDRVLIILFEDLKADPKKVYENTLSFLNVSSDNKTDFPVYNQAKANRSDKLGHFFP